MSFNPWWTFTDPGKTGTCDKCKRPASEHNHTCVACNKVLAPGDAPTFALHGYRDHKPGMKHSSSTVCTCPKSAIDAFIASMPAPVPAVKTATGTVAIVQPTFTAALPAGSAPARLASPSVPQVAAAVPQVAAAVRTAVPAKPRDPDDDACSCGGCGACTAGNECFRPSEGGCNGKCIVCHGMGLLGAPVPQVVPQAAPPVVPLPPGQQGPVKIVQPTLAAPAPPPPVPPEVRCSCTSCPGCTAKTECFRPPDAGDKCIVCYGISLVGVPVAQSAPPTTPFEVPSPLTTFEVPSPPTTPLEGFPPPATSVPAVIDAVFVPAPVKAVVEDENVVTSCPPVT